LVKRIYIDTADEDYIVARWLFLNGLHRYFFWSASQALEKYLKAALLLNGRKISTTNHKLISMFLTLKSFAVGLIPVVLDPPSEVKWFADNESLWGDRTIEVFLAHIEKEGNANNRYNYVGVRSEFGDLYKFDQVVFALRNMAVRLEEVVDYGNVKKTYREIIREFPGQQLFAFGDGIANVDKLPRALYEAFCENNFVFSPKGFEHQTLQLVSEGRVSPLKVLFKVGAGAHSAALRAWAKKELGLKEQDFTLWGV